METDLLDLLMLAAAVGGLCSAVMTLRWTIAEIRELEARCAELDRLRALIAEKKPGTWPG